MASIVYKWAYVKCGKCKRPFWDVRSFSAKGDDLNEHVTSRCGTCRFPTSRAARDAYEALCVRLAGARCKKGGR